MENIFHDVYEKLTTDTRAHADVFNALFDKFLENDKFLKYAADSLAEKMLEKGMIANNLVTDNAEMVLSAPMGKLLKQQLDEQNNNLDKLIVKKTFDFYDEIQLTAGCNEIMYNLTELTEGYKVLMIQPLIAYINSHIPAQITFTEYYNPIGVMRAYSSTNVSIRLFINVLLIK